MEVDSSDSESSSGSNEAEADEEMRGPDERFDGEEEDADDGSDYHDDDMNVSDHDSDSDDKSENGKINPPSPSLSSSSFQHLAESDDLGSEQQYEAVCYALYNLTPFRHGKKTKKGTSKTHKRDRSGPDADGQARG
jgi:hypothetical protein